MRKTLRCLLPFAVLGAVCCPARPAAEQALEVSVIGQTDSTYKRKKLPDGTFKPEGYAITNGGVIPGTIRDESVEKVTFPLIADVVGRHLAKQKYFLAEKAGEFDLLIVLHWGCTSGFADPNYSQSIERSAIDTSSLRGISDQLDVIKRDPNIYADPDKAAHMEVLEKEKQRASDNVESSVTTMNLENRARDAANLENAKVLGYLDAINARRGTVFSTVTGTGNDLMRDIEEKRYFVVVSAYDFHTLQKQKKRVLRWVTRISIRAKGNGFDQRMAQMIASAGSAYGKKSDLSKRYYGDPRVELGEVEYLGVADQPLPPAGEKPAK